MEKVAALRGGSLPSNTYTNVNTHIFFLQRQAIQFWSDLLSVEWHNISIFHFFLNIVILLQDKKILLESFFYFTQIKFMVSDLFWSSAHISLWSRGENSGWQVNTDYKIGLHSRKNFFHILCTSTILHSSIVETYVSKSHGEWKYGIYSAILSPHKKKLLDQELNSFSRFNLKSRSFELKS